MRRAVDILCPYCFERWSTREAAFRCLSTDSSRCKPEPDEALGRYLGSEAPREQPVVRRKGKPGMAFEPKRGKPVTCDCGAPTASICPHCHNRLPQLFTQHPSQSMALIGTKASGKTNYVAVVMHELDHRVGPRFGGALMFLDDHTRDRFTYDFVPRLYKQGLVLEATQSARTNIDVRRPLAARLSLGSPDDARHTNLIFFDSAGEDLQSLGTLEREARYITQADGLVLLIDPLQIPAVRDQLGGRVELPEPTIDPKSMLSRIAGLIREAEGIRPNKPIDKHLALTVSKLDAIRPLLDEQAPVLAASGHQGRFDRADARNVSETLRAQVASWLGEGFDTLVRQNFSSYSYFGVSALGDAPAGGRLTHGVAPHRVEDPVLWMLHEWGAVEGAG